jgi:hypothetical protein
MRDSRIGFQAEGSGTYSKMDFIALPPEFKDTKLINPPFSFNSFMERLQIPIASI